MFERGINWSLGEIPGAPLNEILVCVSSSVCLFVLLRWLLPNILEYLKVLYNGSANLPYTLRIPLQILKRASLARAHPVVYLSSAFYTQSKPTSAFSVKATLLPLLLTTYSESCSSPTVALVASMFWSHYIMRSI